MRVQGRASTKSSFRASKDIQEDTNGMLEAESRAYERQQVSDPFGQSCKLSPEPCCAFYCLFSIISVPNPEKVSHEEEKETGKRKEGEGERKEAETCLCSSEFWQNTRKGSNDFYAHFQRKLRSDLGSPVRSSLYLYLHISVSISTYI